MPGRIVTTPHRGARGTMEVFVQQLINGLTLGSIYGLIAIGYTMVFGIIGMVNFAHGDVFMVSAFIALIAFLILTTWLGISSIALALLIVLIVAMVLTSLCELDDRARRLPAAARLVPPRAADLGDRHVDLPVELRAGRAGPAQQVDPADVQRRDRADVRANGYDVTVSYKQIVIWVVTAVLLAAFWFLVQQDRARPRAARLRAGPEDGGAARHRCRPHDLDHLRDRRRRSPPVAGTMYLIYYGVVSFSDGFVPGVKAFTAAVLGGIGSLPGRGARRPADRPDRDALVGLFLDRLQGRRRLLDPRHHA